LGHNRCGAPFTHVLMPLKRLVAVEFVRRILTWSRPFEGYAEDGAGQKFHVCVKPVLHARPETGPTLGAEVLAAHIAASIDVPSPEAVLVEIEDGFVAATGGELADVTPGLAFGTIWEEGSFPVAKSPADLARVSNPESVAGVTVLDSLLRNTDRHAQNALLVAEGDTGSSFRLVFIDNALSQGIGGAVITGIVICVPRDGLETVVLRQEEFNPYLLGAEGLDLSGVQAEARSVGAYGWGLDGAYADAVFNYLQAAIKEIRPAILSGLSAFPNCR
jgi:hypothetical protein